MHPQWTRKRITTQRRQSAECPTQPEGDKDTCIEGGHWTNAEGRSGGGVDRHRQPWTGHRAAGKEPGMLRQEGNCGRNMTGRQSNSWEKGSWNQIQMVFCNQVDRTDLSSRVYSSSVFLLFSYIASLVLLQPSFHFFLLISFQRKAWLHLITVLCLLLAFLQNGFDEVKIHLLPLHSHWQESPSQLEPVMYLAGQQLVPTVWTNWGQTETKYISSMSWAQIKGTIFVFLMLSRLSLWTHSSLCSSWSHSLSGHSHLVSNLFFWAKF